MLLDDAEDMEEVEEYAHLLVNQSVQMVSAIEAQRDMRAAERGQLKVTDEPVGSLTAIRAAMDLMSGHEVGRRQESGALTPGRPQGPEHRKYAAAENSGQHGEKCARGLERGPDRHPGLR